MEVNPPDADRPESARPQPLGGVVQSYLGYDPLRFGSAQPADASGAARGALEHMLHSGSMRRFSEEDLANAIEIDPSQIAGLGPSIDALIAMLEERRRAILDRYDPSRAVESARDAFRDAAQSVGDRPDDSPIARALHRAIVGEQLRDLERLWYRLPENSASQRALTHALERLREKYEMDQLQSGWEWRGRERLDVPRALEVKQELEEIERLLAQLREAQRNARLAIVDLDALAQFAQQEQIDNLREAQQRVRELLERLAQEAGLQRDDEGGYSVSPKTLRLYQSGLLATIFSDLQSARTGRHDGVLSPDGSVELPSTRPWEFGDSPAALDLPQSMVNALLRDAATRRPGDPVRMRGEDMVVHNTRRQPKCATAVIMDMSGSMRSSGQYVQVKRMALALDGLIRSEYPGDFLQFIEMFTLARLCPTGEVTSLLPKPVTIHDPVVRLRADMSNPDISELDLPPHFTNIQRSLALARQWLAGRPTPNRQVTLITDGLPTAHFEGSDLFMLYPPDQRTERETLREGLRCREQGIVINILLLPSWNQDENDIRFAHRLAESTAGRVFFVAGKDLDRFVVWDYVRRRRMILGARDRGNS
jgi:uncharacterized protein with von Willebrand factor type A (vWA) domain